MTTNVSPRRLVRAEAVLAARRRRLTLVLEDALDRHNVSAVLRTCEAFGIQDVHLVGGDVASGEINPAVASGAERWLTLQRHDSAACAIVALRAQGYRLYVSHLSPESLPLAALPRDERAAYVFGNEQSGVSQEWLDVADARFVIPTSGFTGSLNLSVAAALVVYDRLLLHRTVAEAPGDLDAAEKAELRAAWYDTLAHGSAVLERAHRSRLDDPPAPSPVFPVDRHKT
ncbi:MAG TPA: RNA methyltransferase [Candidatus Krumholzibacteria bacterium]|nr:RNA methyltransferase [Candidatus Krumholzibacteria bacterium]